MWLIQWVPQTFLVILTAATVCGVWADRVSSWKGYTPNFTRSVIWAYILSCHLPDILMILPGCILHISQQFDFNFKTLVLKFKQHLGFIAFIILLTCTAGNPPENTLGRRGQFHPGLSGSFAGASVYLADIIGNYSEGNYIVNRTQHSLMCLFLVSWTQLLFKAWKCM